MCSAVDVDLNEARRWGIRLGSRPLLELRPLGLVLCHHVDSTISAADDL